MAPEAAAAVMRFGARTTRPDRATTAHVTGERCLCALVAAQPKGTARRDLLLELQAKAQAKWAACKAFEVDAPAEGTHDGGKFMVTFPYPYMNGKLHLGHAFSLSKLEFAAAFHRMQVRRTQPMQRGGR
jgi:hypothetical protein